MYYIVKTQYVGPNPSDDQHVDAGRIDIRDTPAITNSSREPRIDGWCGTTNDWAVYAHGEFATIDDARTAIAEKFGAVREIDFSEYSYDPAIDGIIQAFRPGKYIPMSRAATADWIYDGMQHDINAATTDDEINNLASDYAIVANQAGYELDRHVTEMMTDYRQELRNHG